MYRRTDLLLRRVGDHIGVEGALAAFIDRRVDVRGVALDGRDQRLAGGAVMRTDEHIDLLLEHEPNGRFGRFRGRTAGIGRNELDLAPENAAGLVDLFGGKLSRCLLGRAEQRGRTAQGNEQADLEFLRGGRRADKPRQCAERRAGGSAAKKRSPRESLRSNAHVNVSLVRSHFGA